LKSTNSLLNTIDTSKYRRDNIDFNETTLEVQQKIRKLSYSTFNVKKSIKKRTNKGGKVKSQEKGMMSFNNSLIKNRLKNTKMNEEYKILEQVLGRNEAILKKKIWIGSPEKRKKLFQVKNIACKEEENNTRESFKEIFNTKDTASPIKNIKRPMIYSAMDYSVLK